MSSFWWWWLSNYLEILRQFSGRLVVEEGRYILKNEETQNLFEFGGAVRQQRHLVCGMKLREKRHQRHLVDAMVTWLWLK